MSISIRAASLVTAIALASLTARCLAQIEAPSQNPSKEGHTTADSMARFAIDDFVAGCRVRPKPLFADPVFGSLPIHRQFPEPVSLGRLHALGVEELAVFCGSATGDKAALEWNDGIEWAAAARMSKPIELKTLIREWRRSLVPQDEPQDLDPEPVRLEGFDCFKVPAGSFFPPPRIYGRLRFTDPDGKPAKQGVNVGNLYEYRSFVEGGTKASAIFTLDWIDETDLVDGQLPLELRLDVFLTYHPGREFTMAQVELRNPTTGLRSEPVRIEAKSFVNRRLNFPRRLTAIDAKGKRPADLLEDFVSGGRLEVILTGTDEAIYLGVGAFDLNLRPQAFEYISVSGREIVVAQSPTTLAKMLRAPATSVALANRLSQSGEVVIAAIVRQNECRKALEQLLRPFSNGPIARHWAGTLTELMGTIRLNQPAKANVTATFADRQSAGKAHRLCRESIDESRVEAREILDGFIDRIDAMANLATLGFDGVSLAIPRESVEEYEVEHQKRKAELIETIDSALESLHVESEDNILTIEFTQPTSLTSLSKRANYAWAKMDESYARFLVNAEKFELADEVFQLVTDRLPEEPGAWFRRAWHVSYNMPPIFDGYEARYAWVRRGIDVLLDGVEQNPDKMELLWMTAHFIARKIGDSDDRSQYRELLSRDEQLHQRLARYINLERTKSPDKTVDSWLVAKSLFEYCLQREPRLGVPAGIPPLVFYSRPAATQARYARALSDAGHWNEALEAWKHAERLHQELGDRAISTGGKRIRLSDFSSQPETLGEDHASVKFLQNARRFIRYDYWLTQCQFEQTDLVRSVRKSAYNAAQHAKRSEWKMAIEQYRESLTTLVDLHKKHPEQMSLLAGEFSDIAKGYRKAVKQLGLADDESVTSILSLIERSEPLSTFPLLMDPQKLGSSPSGD